MSNINLLLDEENEITFALTVEGTTNSPAKCRLLVEKDDMTLMFEPNYFQNDEVSVKIPPLKHIFKEGHCELNLEVIVEDKYFRPLSMPAYLEKSVEVMAESKVVARPKVQAAASVSQVKVNRKSSTSQSNRKNESRTPVTVEKNTQKVSDKQIMDLIKSLSGGN